MVKNKCARYPKILFGLLLALVCSWALPGLSAAQVDTNKLLNKVGLGQKINTEFVPESAFASAVLFPKQIAEDPKFDIFPREIVTAWGQKELGFDPMLITQATVVVKPIAMGQEPIWAAALHFEKMQGLAGSLIDQLEKTKVGDKTLFRGSGGLPSFLIYDEATLFVGEEELFEDMVNASSKGSLVSLMRGASVKGEIQAFADIEAVRPMAKMLAGQLPGVLPPAVTKLKGIPDMVDAVEIGVTVNTRLETKIIFHASDEEVAKQAGKIVTNALDFGLDMGIGALATQMDFNDPVQEAVVEYAQRAGEEYKERMKPDVNGNKMALNLDQEATVVPILVGMLLPAVQQVRAAARRTSSMNNSRQMILASLNYESAYGHFPAQASYDKNGKPLLSWRVHILPFIEQNELYKQFHLDEPWDSPHNKKLISKMPPAFRSPSSAAPDGKTVYLGISGEGMIFDGPNERKFAEMLDGSSNTAFMVEANDEMAVEWTKPQDYEVDPRNPMRGLGRTQPGGFIVTMTDGSVQFMSSSMDPQEWMKWLTIAGGEVNDR